MHAAMERPLSEAAIRTGNEIFAPDQPRQPHDALGHQFRMLDNVGGMADHAGDENAVRRQLGGFPYPPFMLVTGVSALNDISADFHAQNEVDDIFERHVG